MTPITRTSFLIAIALVLLSTGSFAVVINSTRVAGNQLTITGTGFSGIPLTVTFNGQRVTVLSNSATQIVAKLNSIPAYGSYRLIVQSGTASANSYVSVSTGTILSGYCTGIYYTYALVPLFGLSDNFTDPNCRGWQGPVPVPGLVMATSGTLQNLTVYSQGSCSDNTGGTVMVWLNSAPTALTCKTGTAKSCSNNKDFVPVKAGDAITATVNTNWEMCPGAVQVTVEKR